MTSQALCLLAVCAGAAAHQVDAQSRTEALKILPDPGQVRGLFGDELDLHDGVAVVADSFWTALRARGQLSVEWSTTSPFRTSNSVDTLAEYAAAADAPGATGAIWAENGDASAAIAAADRTFGQLYLSDYAYHAQIEPMAAVADVDADGQGAEVWAGTQTQSWTVRTVAETLGIPAENVRLNKMTMGGGFGRRIRSCGTSGGKAGGGGEGDRPCKT